MRVREERRHGPQPGDAAHLAVEQRHLARGHGQLPGDLGEVALLHRDARREERRRALLGREDPVDDQLGRDDPEACELRAGALGLGDRGRLGMEHEREPGAILVTERRQRPLVLDLGLGDRGRRADARLAGARLGLADALGPGLGQLQEADRVPRRCRVEDHEVEGIAAHRDECRCRRVEEVGEAVEGRHLGGAGPRELLLHDRDDLFGEDLADRRERAVGVLGRRLVGVDLHRPQARAPPAIAVTAWPIGCSNTSARFDAGSVVTIRTRLPASASATAVVQAIVVLPTPPLPEKKRNLVIRS